jgi:hypothetical protein
MVLGQRMPLPCAGTDLVWRVGWIQVVSSAGLTPWSLPVFQVHRLVTVKKHRTHTLWFIRQRKDSNSIGQTGCPCPVRSHEYHSQRVLRLSTGPVIPHMVSRHVINEEARVRFSVGLVVDKVVSSLVQQPVLTFPPGSVLICNWVLAQQD